MSQEELFINGDLLRIRREARGWALSDMAIRACMSVKQIRQLEEGGMSAFYSTAVKATAAKKVGGLLGVSIDEVFDQPTQDVSVESESQEPSIVVPSTGVELASPVQEAVFESKDQISELAAEPTVPTPSEEKKSKTSLWLTAVLFAAALAVAAYMQPHEELAVEPPPPLQVMPSDAVDAASAAELPASNASSVDAVVGAPVVLKSASAVFAVPVAPASKTAP